MNASLVELVGVQTEEHQSSRLNSLQLKMQEIARKL